MTLIDEPRLSPSLQPRAKTIPFTQLLRLWITRFLLVIAGLAAWFFTQWLIGSRSYNGRIDDGLLNALAAANAYLAQHAAARNALLISSSAVIDVLALFMLFRAIFGPTIRPFLGLIILFGLRQIFQGLCVLPMPEGMLWERPPFPSLLVTYGVSNDLFFSGHTALAVFGAVEIVRFGGKKLLPLGIAIALFEIVTVLALRAHWTMDVYAGAVSALLVALLVDKLAPSVDRFLAILTGARQSLGHRPADSQ